MLDLLDAFPSIALEAKHPKIFDFIGTTFRHGKFVINFETRTAVSGYPAESAAIVVSFENLKPNLERESSTNALGRRIFTKGFIKRAMGFTTSASVDEMTMQ